MNARRRFRPALYAAALFACPTVGAPAAEACEGTALRLPVLLVGDGDTIDVEATLDNGQKIPIALRIEGMDAPETDKDRADCDAEIAAGKEAKAYAETLLGGSATVYLRGVKDFYGRLLACITLDDGRDYAQTMIAAGYAVKGTRNGDWCK